MIPEETCLERVDTRRFSPLQLARELGRQLQRIEELEAYVERLAMLIGEMEDRLASTEGWLSGPSMN